MKVTVNQNIPQNIPCEVKLPTISCPCHKCYSILEIERSDLMEGADKYGHWFYVRCGACGEETGIPEILVKRLE
jgi:hypothetical protein